jgi:hypothetical protein
VGWLFLILEVGFVAKELRVKDHEVWLEKIEHKI